MRSQPLGSSPLRSSVLSFGNMRCLRTWNPAEATAERRDAAVQMHVAAYEAGYTLFDTADIYCSGACEEVLGQALRAVPGLRQRIILATKCGIRRADTPNPGDPGRYDFSRDYILASCDASLKRLGVETIDLYHLHRPDVLMQPAEVAEAFDRLHAAGKVRFFGVSNFLPSTLGLLQSALRQKLIVNQVEIHLGRLDPFVDGTLEQCLEKMLTPLAWSPLGGGWLGTGAAPKSSDPNYPLRALVVAELDAVARELGVSRSVAALAWLLKHPAGIIPIVGSASVANIRDAAKAADVTLMREQWYRLYIAARGKNMP